MSALFRSVTKAQVDDEAEPDRGPRHTLTDVEIQEYVSASHTVNFRNKDILQHSRPRTVSEVDRQKLSIADLGELREKGSRVAKRRDQRTKGKLSKKERMRLERSLMDEHAMRMCAQDNQEQRRVREVLFMLMSELPARQLLGVSSNNVLKIPVDAPIADAFNMLLDKHFLSAPVFDESKNKYIGFLSLMDLVSWVVLVHHERSLQNGTVGLETILKRESSWQRDMRQHVSEKRGYPSGQLIPPDKGLPMDPVSLSNAIAGYGKHLVKVFAKRRPIGHLPYDATCLEASHMLADQHRRIALMSEDKSEIIGILSQSRFANFVAVEKELWSATLQRESLSGTLMEWGFNSRKFVKAKSSHTALEAFELMNKSNALALPIVDHDTGVLVGELSPEHLRGLIATSMANSPRSRQSKSEAVSSEDSLELLRMPVLEFLERIRLDGDVVVKELTTMKLQDSFSGLFDLFRIKSVRRIYVLDDTGVPVMACSLKDAIAALVYSEESSTASVEKKPELSAETNSVVDRLLPLCTISLEVPSAILNFVELSWLWIHLPATSRHKQWKRAFSLSEDGASLQTLLTYCGNHGREPMVTVIRDENNQIFGCYTSEPWKANVGVHGNGYSFVFTWGQKMENHGAPPESEDGTQEFIQVYKCEPDFNGIMMYATTNELSIGGGGGGAAIMLDAQLKYGTSQDCQTFSSKSLSASPNYQVMDLEVWALGSL